jgi:hypothetical protein
MWQGKSSEAIRRVDRRLRFSPVFALGFSVFAASVMTVAMSWGFRGYLLPRILQSLLLERSVFSRSISSSCSSACISRGSFAASPRSLINPR